MTIVDPVILWTIVGGGAGIILGLAGTGGGVISIPILVSLGGYNIKDASGYGLLALMVGAALSWLIQRKNTLYPISAVLILFAGTIAFLTAPLKALAPHWLIILILNVTCLFSLYSLWILRNPADPGEDLPLAYQLKTATVGGMITGFLSTMTGLGGGVVIIPWLTAITRLKFEQAMACSLLTIAATAPLSAWRQGKFDLTLEEWAGLTGGIIVTGLIVKRITKYIAPFHMILVRKLTMTSVIFMVMLKTLEALF